MTVSIGDGGDYAAGGQDTTVTNSDGETVTARGGSPNDGNNGGSGWSGGGGSRSGGGGAGGYNGGDGQDGSGWSGGYGGKGHYTSLPTVAGVCIVAGAGGQTCSNSQYCFGGGGGGILINGDGRRDDGRAAQGCGPEGSYYDDRAAQGYGSGGGPYGVNGMSGAVILYV